MWPAAARYAGQGVTGPSRMVPVSPLLPIDGAVMSIIGIGGDRMRPSTGQHGGISIEQQKILSPVEGNLISNSPILARN